MAILGIILAAALIGGGVIFVAHVIKQAREAAQSAAPKTGTRKTRAKTTARNAPQNVRTILTQAWADNWVAKRAHQRTAAAPKPQRRPLMQRLIVRGGHGQPGSAPAQVPAAAGGTPPASANGQRPATPAAAAQPYPRPRLVPNPSPGRTPQMPSSNGGAPTGTGTSSDLFSAANALAQQAMAGGIRDKARAIKVFKEAFEGLAEVLNVMATRMAEPGSEYPAMVYEPILTASTHLQAAGMSMGESDNGMTSLMNMPVGELAASPVHAPHNTELNAG